MPRHKPTSAELDDPLTDEELDRLGEILLDHVDEDAVTDDSDEGILDISTLDGFLTAIVSAPVTIMPSQWLPAVWGDFEPVWDGIGDYQEFMSLVMRHLNSIVLALTYEPEWFEPMFMENTRVNPPVLIVDEWCEGYMRGVELARAEWNAGGEAIATLLAPIRAFSSEPNWLGHALDDSAEADALRDAITPNIRAIHAYWLARRRPGAAAGAPALGIPGTVVRDAPRVGRNDPCPCGSGKKYKKCCLQ